MRIDHITKTTPETEVEILGLIETIEDEELDKEAVVRMISANCQSEGLFGVFDGEKLVGLVYFDSPNALYPHRGYMFFAAINPVVPLHVSREMFEMGLKWLKKQGATQLWGWTRRSPRVINRLYGFEVSDERQVYRSI